MIERADISSVLTQIRSAQGQINSGMHSSSMGLQPLVSGLQEGGVNSVAGVNSAAEVKEVPSFATMLKQAIDKVNDQQKETGDLRTRYEMGDPDVDIVNVMIASQKSTVAFEAMSQVRTRLVTAYQEIMRMPI
ncbi:flagellar hook-basal body complex protein FliE [Marinospirillum insulare]|uniref:Flagellar hook-basal body complex protein FliE n=1 Tax=Marinospirillum insulare TaxID=217169 RepID=A0ABQ5ZX57_9GAMM|nr:flagellar hook-basal body complex protein FliE [Marinospirillum insulare]GLR63923.1 hypothetical protein GCM10007878_13600 [Marinospirillum insulare]